eukprot:gene22005-21965_t
MLATLFDFPWADRRKLTRWSDVATAIPGQGIVETEEEGQLELLGCLEYFTRLWNERINAPPQPDLISMLCHGESTKNMEPMEYLGNIILLIVGGNDTTRNSITGGLLALNQNPAEYDKLRADPALIPSMVSEIIRWQTPLAHMRRTCVQDTVVGGKTIKAGDKVVMWYVSGNRDETVIDNPNAFIIDRERPRHHLSFGFGIHRCVGNRLAEMQLRIVWEEVLKRFPRIEVVGEPTRVYSSFVKGYDTLPVAAMADGTFDKQAADRAAALSTPLQELNPGLPDRFAADSFWPVFERLRREDPVHYTAESEWGPYWSVTRFEDIVAVDTNHQAFSSDAHLGGITLADFNPDFMLPMFIAMDQPKHDVQRKTVSPSVSPQRLMELEPVIRERAGRLLDELPIGEEFDWVDRISIELTTQMLAT